MHVAPPVNAMTVRRSSPCHLVLALIALVAVAALPGGGCKSKSQSPPAGDRAEILIGGTLPLTGAEARTGGFFKEGYDLALEEINKAGGVEVGGKKLPVKLTLIV
jgi:branched-chain amino acid transport system substrate-binding protein